MNANFEAIDTDAGLTDAAIAGLQTADTLLDGRVTTLEGGAGRGALTQYTVNSIAALNAISTAVVGDTAFLTASGTTGVDAFKWVAVSGSGATIKWSTDGVVVADTKAHLDAFISAVVALSPADLLFTVGGEAFVSGTRVRYYFTSTAGGYVPQGGLVPILPASVAGAGVTLGADGKITFAAAPAVSVNSCFTSEFDNYKIFINVTAMTSGDPRIMLRAAGIDSSGGSYDWAIHYHNAGAYALSAVNSQGSLPLGPIAATSYQCDLEVFSPALGVETNWALRSRPYPGSTVGVIDAVGSGKHRAAMSHDGFTFFSSGGGTVTGEARIYGYNNN